MNQSSFKDFGINFKIMLITIFSMVLLINMPFIMAVPSGPNIDLIRNQTLSPSSAHMINTSGGSITTMVLNSTTQNIRWKAFVGNITGKLTLDDGDGYSVFDWSISTFVGEVYATRSPNYIGWSNINCSTVSNISNEEIALNHTANPNDNISTTFNAQDHSSFYVGHVMIPSDNCYSVHTYVNASNQSADFEEVLLHDGTSMVYSTVIENDVKGYRPNETFDFQMIVPEVGLNSWTSSTPYYFYVELI
ncbi:MAG: hypothetical protein ABII01_00675 [Candidatus Woesearchaeota archaeon]